MEKNEIETILSALMYRVAQLEAHLHPRITEIPFESRGVFLHKSRDRIGYTVIVDGHDLDLAVSWADANEVATLIGKNRPQIDPRGYSRKKEK